MPILDRERGTVVVRVVYDGPPRSGKTTSMEALAGALSGRRKSEIFTPETAAGRTLYFDWLDYTGGLMGGYQVRCQIVSVPGQREYAERRAFLLASADVVIFVADGSEAGLDESAEQWESLERSLPRTDDGPIGVVVQTNKRDLPGSVPLAEVRRRFAAGPHVAILESVATKSRGVREAFVFAIRLALDRVRHLMQTNALAVGRPEVEDGLELLSRMRAAEAARATVAGLLAATLETELPEEPPEPPPAIELPPEIAPDLSPPLVVVPPTIERAPLLPAPDLPSGLVWPPVIGRVMLSELPAERILLVRSATGGWSERSPGNWRVLSRPSGSFSSLEEGRRTLIQHARLHAGLKEVLSESRGLALAETGGGEWRLWQIVRRETTLRDALEGIGVLARPSEVAGRLLAVVGRIAAAEVTFLSGACRLPISLDTIAWESDAARFVDFLPEPERLNGGPLPEDAARERQRRLLKPQLDDLRERRLLDAPATVAALRSQLPLERERRHHLELLVELLGG